MEYGHVKISRKAYREDQFWNEPRVFSKWEAWEWMIQAAAWKAHRRVIGMTVIEVQRGEFLASVRFLAEAWGWKRSRVHAFLGLLVELNRIAGQRETAAGTVYLLVNYDQYQGGADADQTPDRTASGQEPDSERTASGQSRSSKAVKAGEANVGQSVVPLRGSVDVETAADQIIRAANKGMAENPSLPHAEPIYVGHASRQTVIDWLADGIGWEVARDACYRLAKEWAPRGLERQISSMRYFDLPVRKAWEREQANNTEVNDGGTDHERTGHPGASAQARGEAPRGGRPSRFEHKVINGNAA